MMSSSPGLFADLTDAALLECVSELVREERRATVQLVAALAELDRRRLYLAQGCSSLFSYCTQNLHLSEHAAYNRIEAARAVRRFPVILERLEHGLMTLTAVRLLSPVLTLDNHEQVLAEAAHKPRREIEILVARLRPLPDAATVIRRLPAAVTVAQAATGETAPTAPPTFRVSFAVADRADSVDNSSERKSQMVHAPVSTCLSPDRYKIQFTAPREFQDKLRRAQALLRHAVPNGDPSEILGRALDLLLPRLEARKAGATTRPRPTALGRPTGRHIPAAVKREVWKRDNGCCAFVGAQGRCGEHAFLEFHHVVPFAHGGAATTGNIELRCRTHNAYEADRIFKPMFAE